MKFLKKSIYFSRGKTDDIERDEEVIISSSKPEQMCEIF